MYVYVVMGREFIKFTWFWKSKNIKEEEERNYKNEGGGESEEEANKT
jgi:hypothetical protein